MALAPKRPQSEWAGFGAVSEAEHGRSGFELAEHGTRNTEHAERAFRKTLCRGAAPVAPRAAPGAPRLPDKQVRSKWPPQVRIGVIAISDRAATNSMHHTLAQRQHGSRLGRRLVFDATSHQKRGFNPPSPLGPRRRAAPERPSSPRSSFRSIASCFACHGPSTAQHTERTAPSALERNHSHSHNHNYPTTARRDAPGQSCRHRRVCVRLHACDRADPCSHCSGSSKASTEADRQLPRPLHHLKPIQP